jgi:integrase
VGLDAPRPEVADRPHRESRFELAPARLDAQELLVAEREVLGGCPAPVEVDRIVENVTILEAVEKRAKLIEEAKGAVDDESGPKPKLGAYARDCWISAKDGNVDDSTTDTYSDVLERWVLPRFGEHYIDKITARDVQDYINELKADGYAPNTIRSIFAVLRQLLDRACGQHNVPLLAWRLVEKPKLPHPNARHGKKNRITEEQLARTMGILRSYPFLQPFYAMVMVLASTGLRFCHVAALRWEDLDENGNLRIARKVWHRKVGDVTAIKSAPDVIKLDPYVHEALTEHRQRLVATQHRGVSSGWMFPSEVGKPRDNNDVGLAWRDAKFLAMVDRQCTLHGIRHTFHDITRRAQIPESVIKAMAGHATEAMHNLYSKPSLEETAAAGGAVVRLVKGRKGGDGGGDQNASKQDATSDSARVGQPRAR